MGIVSQFIQAKNFTPTGGRDIDLWVVHTMENDEKPDGAENVARWFAGPTTPRASAHYNIDNDSIVQGVRDDDVAWAAPGANHDGIQVEHAGRAGQGRAGWDDKYSRRELRLSARLAARKARRYRLPIRKLTAEDLRNDLRGFCGHADVSQAFGLSTHTDPGPDFPWKRYLRWTRIYAAGRLPARKRRRPWPTLREGDHGWRVKHVQKLLKARGFNPGPLDAVFGRLTGQAVRSFQRNKGLTVDGHVDRRTLRKLRRP